MYMSVRLNLGCAASGPKNAIPDHAPPHWASVSYTSTTRCRFPPCTPPSLCGAQLPEQPLLLRGHSLHYFVRFSDFCQQKDLLVVFWKEKKDQVRVTWETENNNNEKKHMQMNILIVKGRMTASKDRSLVLWMLLSLHVLLKYMHLTSPKKNKKAVIFSAYVKQQRSIWKEGWKPFKSLYDLLWEEN